MEKDKSILLIIEKIKSVVDFHLIQIVDYWDADLCAIGLKKGNKLVYISTFNAIDEAVAKYDYDLEIVDENLIDKIDVVREGRGVSERELIDELRLFLSV